MANIPVEPIIANTTMEKYVDGNGEERAYQIAPIEGYVLHDSRKDYQNPNNLEETIEGFATYGVSVPITYDFEANPFNLYTRLASEVPDDQIFGGGTTEPEPEVM